MNHEKFKFIFLIILPLISIQAFSNYLEKTNSNKNNQIQETNTNQASKKSKNAVTLSNLAGENNLISVHLKNASLRDFLRNISSEYDINFVYSEEIGSKKISINFKETPLFEAITAILEIHALGLTKLSNKIIQIETIKKIQEKKTELKQAKIASTHLIPTKISIFRLSYAKASNLAPIVKEILTASSMNDPRVKVSSNERTNSLIVEAIPTDLEKVNGLVKRMDLQTPQVKIETRVIEVLKNMGDSLGINWTAPLRIDKGRGLGFGNLIFPNNMISNFSIDTGATSIEGSKFDTHFGSINNSVELDLKIRLSESYKISRSLENNTILVLDNEPAMIKAGQVDFFSVEKSQGQKDIVNVSYELSLEVTPHITADGSVQMKIKIENSDPIFNASKATASKNERIIDTSLIRKSGETAVIGGLYNTSTTKTTDGIPFLSRIPLLSLLFSSQTFTENKRELIIMVTPTIINTEKAFTFADNNHSPTRGNTKQENNFFNNLEQENLEENFDEDENFDDNQNFNDNSNFNNENNFNQNTNNKNNLQNNNKENNNWNNNNNQINSNRKNSKNNYKDLIEDDAFFEKENDINESYDFENFE